MPIPNEPVILLVVGLAGLALLCAAVRFLKCFLTLAIALALLSALAALLWLAIARAWI